MDEKSKPSWWHSGSLTPDDVDKINEMLEKATREVQEITWAAGRPITIAEDGWIVEVWPDGKRVRIKEIGPLTRL